MLAYTTAVVVELLPECIASSLDTTASVIVCAIVTIACQGLANFLPLDAHTAPVRCMKSHLISESSAVGGLHDIDFSIHGPIRLINEPQGGPSAAAKRRVQDVKDEEAGVVGLFGLDADGASAGSCSWVGCVDLEDGGSSRCKS